MVERWREVRIGIAFQPNFGKQTQSSHTFVQGIRGLVATKSRRPKQPRSTSKGKRDCDVEDVGKGESRTNKRTRTMNLNQATEKAGNSAWRLQAVQELRDKMFSKSTQAAKNSKRKKIWDILRKICGERPVFPLEVNVLEELGAVILQCGLRAGDQYMGEAKLMQLESGFEWSQVLERKLTTVKRALKREIGPEKRAKEFKIEGLEENFVDKVSESEEGPELPVGAFVFATTWMLRCAEVVAVRCCEVKFMEAEKFVQLTIRKSKMDQKGLGVKRTLRCCEASPCSATCPMRVARRLVASAMSRGGYWLFADKREKQITKYMMIKAWNDFLDRELTGHSPRRSGAMLYSRRGMAVPDIGFLGRWRSSAIFRYVEEALAELPLNSRTYPGEIHRQKEETKRTEVVERIVKERSTAEGTEVQTNTKPLWAISISSRGKVAHRVERAAWGLSISQWTTVCGWRFARNNVKVELTRSKEIAIPVCKKCKELKSTRDKVRGGVQLAQWLET
eukprot:Skav223057  [mRNA]  locus=scaffold1069:397339:398856:+ [translate_table: standard]